MEIIKQHVFSFFFGKNEFTTFFLYKCDALIDAIAHLLDPKQNLSKNEYSGWSSSNKTSPFNVHLSHLSYHAWFQIHWDSWMLIILNLFPLSLLRKATPLIRSHFHWRDGGLIKGPCLLNLTLQHDRGMLAILSN